MTVQHILLVLSITYDAEAGNGGRLPRRQERARLAHGYPLYEIVHTIFQGCLGITERPALGGGLRAGGPGGEGGAVGAHRGRWRGRRALDRVGTHHALPPARLPRGGRRGGGGRGGRGGGRGDGGQGGRGGARRVARGRGPGRRGRVQLAAAVAVVRAFAPGDAGDGVPRGTAQGGTCVDGHTRGRPFRELVHGADRGNAWGWDYVAEAAEGGTRAAAFTGTGTCGGDEDEGQEEAVGGEGGGLEAPLRRHVWVGCVLLEYGCVSASTCTCVYPPPLPHIIFIREIQIQNRGPAL